MRYLVKVCLTGLTACFCLVAQAGSLCLDRPIKFSHYVQGLLFTEGVGGIDDDVQQELERRSGCKFLVDVRPRARIWYEMEGGTVDMAGSGVETTARDKFAWFAFYIVEYNKVYVGPRVPTSIKSFEDFIDDTNLMIGGVSSYSYSPYYDQQVQKLTSLGTLHRCSRPQRALPHV